MTCKIGAAELIRAHQAIECARGQIASDVQRAEAIGETRVMWRTLTRWRDATELARALIARIVESCNVRVQVAGSSVEPEEDPDEEQDTDPYAGRGHRSDGTGLLDA